MRNKALLVAGGLLIIYMVLMWMKPGIWVGQPHQAHQNILKAEKFLYDANYRQPSVIIGSSLAYHINTNMLPNFINLSMGGQSLYDGLMLIRESGWLPEKVFIESNFPQLAIDEEFTGELFSPIMHPLRTYLPVLRRGKQPLSLVNYIRTQIMSKHILMRTEEEGIQLTKTSDKDELKSIIIDKRKKDLSQKLKKADLASSLARLEREIFWLQQRGVLVFLFEMPISAELMHLQQPTQIRQSVIALCQKLDLKFIAVQNTESYQTTDGIHLSTIEGERYTQYFKKYIENSFTP